MTLPKPRIIFSVAAALFFAAVSAAGLSGQLNLNQASEEELRCLPYIGRERARAIVDYRKERGRFESVDELLQAADIGEATLEAVRPYLKLNGPSSLSTEKGKTAPQAEGPKKDGPASLSAETIRIVATNPGDIRVLADDEYFGVLTHHIREAKHRVDLAMFLFKITKSPGNRSAAVVTELGRAKKRGVAVAVLLERSDYDESINRENEQTAKRLRQNGIDARFDSLDATSHAKIVVIDDRYCFVGSHNLTHSALRHNRELTLFVDSASLAAQLREYIRSL